MVCPGCIAAVFTWAGLYGFSSIVKFKSEVQRRRAMKRAVQEPARVKLVELEDNSVPVGAPLQSVRS